MYRLCNEFYLSLHEIRRICNENRHVWLNSSKLNLRGGARLEKPPLIQKTKPNPLYDRQNGSAGRYIGGLAEDALTLDCRGTPSILK
jgi:hypothetical protein